MPSRLLIPIAVASLILIWGTTWAAIRIGLEGIPPFTGVAIRFALAGLVLLAIGRLIGVPGQRNPTLYRVWFVETVFAFCLSYGVVYWAEQWVTSGLASILFSTMPLFVAVLAHWWLPDEPFRAIQLGGIALGFSGVAVIFSDDITIGSSQVLLAAGVFLISPIVAAVSHVLVKKWGSGIHPINIVSVPMLLTGLLMGLIAVGFERHRPIVFDAKSVGALLYLVILGTAVTFTVYYWVLERVAATRLSLITFGIPVVAVLVGVIFLDEPFGIKTVLGSLLVLSGVGMALKS